ncbi:hypothetical protein HanPSC8_Chr14g0627141 [Helianthus annuus]|nr:hypothetical protein HanPSC8_Chr14g0627141 [Helianthus annuus]
MNTNGNTGPEPSRYGSSTTVIKFNLARNWVRKDPSKWNGYVMNATSAAAP